MPSLPLRLAAFLALCLSLLLPPAAQAGVTVKLATLAPEGTIWYRAVRTMADRWAEISGGEVKIKIYPGGVVGNETAKYIGLLVYAVRANDASERKVGGWELPLETNPKLWTPPDAPYDNQLASPPAPLYII